MAHMLVTVGDHCAAPGQVNGQGVKDAWYVLLPDGTMNKEAAAMSTATPAS
ncbi:hypothetical protein ACUJ8O_10840 [Micrococcus sp. EWR3.9.1]|uniref:hypothetical protein n=1 Tax=Micrococcus sp. EWR3.9.1 TaxID=3461010 RepID=UPI00155EC3C8